MTAPRIPAGSASHTIVPAAPSSAGVLAELIAGAFFPLAVSQWLIWDGAERRRIFPPYFRLYVEHALAAGLVDTTADLAAAALWFPGTGPAAPLDGYDERLAAVTGPWLGRFRVFDQQLAASHLSGEEHLYLALLAVEPGRQGEGLGTALLQARHAALDRMGAAAYLVASGQRTRRMYLRHGYEDYGGPVVLPGGLAAGPGGIKPPAEALMYPMRRPAVSDLRRGDR